MRRCMLMLTGHYHKAFFRNEGRAIVGPPSNDESLLRFDHEVPPAAIFLSVCVTMRSA